MPYLLEASSTTDRRAWSSLWQQTGREPFAHPNYVETLCDTAERAAAVVLEQDSGSALVPLILRKLPPIGGACGMDASSPYGYGGPFSVGTLDLRQVVRELQEWTQSAGLCSLAVRSSLHVRMDGDSIAEGVFLHQPIDNVCVDLRRAPANLWMNYEHKVRKNVNKSLRNGCRVEVRESIEQASEFVDVYRDTMRRRRASDWYHFTDSFFAKLGVALAAQHKVFLVLDRMGKVISAELVLQSDSRLYSFLGGARLEAMSLGASDLLKHEVVRYGQETGRQSYVLGGGRRRGDGIFRFKRAFDPSGVIPFQVLGIIGNEREYDARVERRSLDHPGINFAHRHFPAYRAPVVEEANS